MLRSAKLDTGDKLYTKTKQWSPNQMYLQIWTTYSDLNSWSCLQYIQTKSNNSQMISKLIFKE